MEFKKVCMIGLGYIGLPTAAVLASRKVNVIGVDINQQAVDTINRGEIHIVEPKLDILVHSTVKEGYLRATMTPEKADAFIVAVPTPFKGDNYEPNLDYVESATRALAKVLEKGNLVILESTSPVGTTEKMAGWLAEERSDLTFPQQLGEDSDIRIAHCPERVLPGQVIRELVENDRIIGGITPKCTEVATELYKIFVDGECIATNARTAEMSKLTENASRDVSIAFANELSILCEKMDIDVWELISLANRHPRVDILRPSVGVGGHCIAVDPWFIVHAGGDDAKIIRTAREVNTYKTEWVVEKIKNEALKFENKNGKKATIACMGLAFKPDIDDLRESPALYITRRLISEGLAILAVEPNIENFDEFDIVHYKDAIEESDVVALLVAHKEFKDLDIDGSLDFCGIAN